MLSTRGLPLLHAQAKENAFEREGRIDPAQGFHCKRRNDRRRLAEDLELDCGIGEDEEASVSMAA